jgi:CheY-like chemotaxis protein
MPAHASVAWNLLYGKPASMLLMRHVLISDDDDQMRELLANWFQRVGYRTAVARDGVELLALLDRGAQQGSLPDLVISDVRMPGMDGLSALARIQDQFPDVPVVLITSFGDGGTHRRARALGAAAVLDKPFDLRELVDTVETLLTNNRDE